MKHYDFDQIICREHTASVKFHHEKSCNCLSMWIADMDFPVADEIVEAVKKRAEHPIFGYSYLPEELFEGFIHWHETRHGATYKKENILPYYSVVGAIDLILNALTKPGDGVTIMSPVYMYFWESLKDTGRKAVASPLKNVNHHYEIDFANLEACFAQSKVFLMCSPHNPAGRVWTRDELEKIADLAIRYDVLVIADEIHSDLIMPGVQHTPFCLLGEEIRNRTITLLSATKTFNIAQAGMSFLISDNAHYLDALRNEMQRYHLGAQNVFAAVMVQAAFTHGGPWLDQVIAYVHGNYSLIQKTLSEKMPDIKILPLEGTYLIWLDCRNIDLPVVEFFETRSHVLGEDGILFGEDGAHYYRINIATPRKNIEEMLSRMEKTYCECHSSHH